MFLNGTEPKCPFPLIWWNTQRMFVHPAYGDGDFLKIPGHIYLLYSILLFVNGSVVLGLNQFELIFKSQRISEHISLICTSLCALMGSAEQSHQQVQSRVEATQAGRTVRVCACACACCTSNCLSRRRCKRSAESYSGCSTVLFTSKRVKRILKNVFFSEMCRPLCVLAILRGLVWDLLSGVVVLLLGFLMICQANIYLR